MIRSLLLVSLIFAIQSNIYLYGVGNECIDRAGSPILPGSYEFSAYISDLKGKNIAVVANQTSMINTTHLIDTLLKKDIKIVKVFAPEHGFRGQAADGARVDNSFDEKTGIPIISLYGKLKKPSPEYLKNVECVVFDIQDVGARFYTYISTLTYIMEACAENNIPLIVLDRPNPNGFYVDGPVLNPPYASFVGLHSVPVVYGLTIGEYALMVNGEKWLTAGVQCDLKVVKCKNYTHKSKYQLPVPPSPNLPNMKAVYLYPSLCFFEGTIVSVGRGTDMPFEMYGHPKLKQGNSYFTPKSIKGVSDSPPLKGEMCKAVVLSDLYDSILRSKKLNLSWLLSAFHDLNIGNSFFTSYFEQIAGTDSLRKQILEGSTEKSIRDSWQKDIDKYLNIRNKYLLYPDF